ncbi:CubicO group peptidase (beta-lactamase class C family) [Sphingomonas sp. UYAg733]
MKLTCLALIALTMPTLLRAEPPRDFKARVEAVRRQIGVPGIAIAIVENDSPAWTQGFGVKELGKAGLVDADTLFLTGSTGKAFTSAALAILVDRGRIAWDDKVIDHMPWFQMYDPWVTREMTIRDLLVHRSGLGLGAGDLMFVPRSDRTRKASVEALRYIKPATSFRSGYAYDNLLYMAAGQLIEEVSGKTWETFVADEILAPAGMKHTTTTNAARFRNPDRAQPHTRIGGAIRGVGALTVLAERGESAANSAPAGGLAVSANDIARWLRLQLDGGSLPGGQRLFSQAARDEMWTPVVIQPIDPRPVELQATQPMFYTYALGWDVQDYRGTKIVWHAGAMWGFLTAIVLIPEKNVAFSIMINSEDGEVIRGLMYELLDHYLGLPAGAWPEKYAAYKNQRIKTALEAFQAQTRPSAPVGPSLALENYTGDYVDPWYGKISVRRDKAQLSIDFTASPGMTGKLDHHQFDTFVTRFPDKSLEPAYVTFALDADGKVKSVTMKPVSPLADFSYDYQDLLFTPTGRAK